MSRLKGTKNASRRKVHVVDTISGKKYSLPDARTLAEILKVTVYAVWQAIKRKALLQKRYKVKYAPFKRNTIPKKYLNS